MIHAAYYGAGGGSMHLISLWQCRKSVPPKSFTFTLRDRGGVSQLTGRKEDIRKRVVPEKFASSVRFAVVRGLPCDVERLPLVELVLPVSDVGCFAEFHVTFKRCTPGSSALSKVVRKTSDGCSSTCSGVGQNPQHAPVSLWLKNLPDAIPARDSKVEMEPKCWNVFLLVFFFK